jgi:hypothetical protein
MLLNLLNPEGRGGGTIIQNWSIVGIRESSAGWIIGL